MPIAFDRTICCDLHETISREWLITNGRGGYAAGTIAGTLTRLQHGVLVAAPDEGQRQYAPQVLLAKIDEEVAFDQRTYYLGTNEYKDGTLNPAGFVHLERFRLEEGFPVFTYRLGGIDGILLEKRIWMPQDLNTTYLHYRVVRTTLPEQGDWPHSSQGQGPARRTSRLLEDAHASQRIISLALLPFASYRKTNEPLRGDFDWQFHVQPQHITLYDDMQESRQSIAGCTIRAYDDARAYHIFVIGHADSQTTFLPTGVWYWNILHREDQVTDDLYLPGVFRTKLWPGDDVDLTIIVTAEDLSGQSFNARQLKRAYAQAVEDLRDYTHAQRYFGEGGVSTHMYPVLPPASNERLADELSPEEFLRTLLQAGSRFLAQRPYSLDEAGSRLSPIFSGTQTIPTIFSGFYDMSELTRDTLIALPGLTLTPGRYSEARRILLTLGHSFRKGLLPDRLPAPGRPLDDEDYSSSDTMLWYFYALDAYLRATHDENMLEELYPRLGACISSLLNGERSDVRIDPHDGLLLANRPCKATTWMKACCEEAGNVPLTPRSGKAVEVNALWYHALSLMQEWSERLHKSGRIAHISSAYDELRRKCQHSFNERFWYEEGGWLYDVIDGPDGDDASLRPNQLFAFSLRYPVLDPSRWRAALDVITRRLLTPYGLRSLAPQCSGYTGQIAGDDQAPGERARGAFNGGAWPWLVGAYIDALCQVEGVDERLNEGLRTTGRSNAVRNTGIRLLDHYRRHMSKDLLGMPGEVYDGDEPQRAHGQLASARSTGELLRAYKRLALLGVRSSDQAVSV
jgi:glycogen debranching enzyme